MNVWENYRASWQQIFNYHGKTRRRDFWAAIIGMALVTLVVSLLLSPALTMSGGIAVSVRLILDLFFIAQFLQYLSLSVRRLHSLRLPGEYQWLMLLPGLHMIVLHALPEAEQDHRAPWYHMIDADNQPTSLVVDHRGYVHGILGNAFGYTWRNFFNFRETTSRGNYLWARVAWGIFGTIYGILLAIGLFISAVLMFGRRLSEAALLGGTSNWQGVAGPLVLLAMLGIALSLPVWLPKLALMARRLHDQQLSAGWVFLALAGRIGQLILLLLTLLPASLNQTKYPAADGGAIDDGALDDRSNEQKSAAVTPPVEIFYPTSMVTSEASQSAVGSGSGGSEQSLASDATSASESHHDDQA